MFRHRATYAIIIPICNEEECLGVMLDELIPVLPTASRFLIAIGLNATTDRSGEIAASRGALVGETPLRGYGHGCHAAIEAAIAVEPDIEAFVFLAGDGANDPADLPALLAAYESGYPMVLGTRTTSSQNWRRSWQRNLANLILGFWASVLSGVRYWDLGPYRIIGRELFDAMKLRERTWGWTIEAQIRAAKLGTAVASVPVRERKRIAGQQKINSVSLGQSLAIGWAIVLAGWRTARHDHAQSNSQSNLPT